MRWDRLIPAILIAAAVMVVAIKLAFAVVDVKPKTEQITDSSVFIEKDTERLSGIDEKAVFGPLTKRETISTEQTEPETIAEEVVLTEVAVEDTYEEPETGVPVVETETPTTQAIVVDGNSLDSTLYEYLRCELSAYGKEWAMPYALAQIRQESSFDPYAVNQRNGEDKGLLQYKERYWAYWCEDAGTSGDIFDPYTQIRVYVYHLSKWIDETGSIEQAISNHYTGGIGYSEEYVADVMRWVE